MVPFIFSMHEIPVAVLLWSGWVHRSLRLELETLVVLALCQRAWGRDLCWASCFTEGETEAVASDGARMGVWTLSPSVHEVFLQQQQGLHWLKCLSPHAMHVVDEVFHVPFPMLCRGRDRAGGRRISAVAAPEPRQLVFPWHCAWLFFRRHTIELTLILILFF